MLRIRPGKPIESHDIQPPASRGLLCDFFFLSSTVLNFLFHGDGPVIVFRSVHVEEDFIRKFTGYITGFRPLQKIGNPAATPLQKHFQLPSASTTVHSEQGMSSVPGYRNDHIPGSRARQGQKLLGHLPRDKGKVASRDQIPLTGGGFQTSMNSCQRTPF